MEIGCYYLYMQSVSQDKVLSKEEHSYQFKLKMKISN